MKSSHSQNDGPLFDGAHEQCIAVREWTAGHSFLTIRDGWSNNFENACLFPSVEAARVKLRGRPAEVRPANQYMDLSGILHT